jgi:hypothetical protein
VGLVDLEEEEQEIMLVVDQETLQAHLLVKEIMEVMVVVQEDQLVGLVVEAVLEL